MGAIPQKRERETYEGEVKVVWGPCLCGGVVAVMADDLGIAGAVHREPACHAFVEMAPTEFLRYLSTGER